MTAIRTTIVLVLVATGAIAGYLAAERWFTGDEPARLASGSILPEPLPLSEFELFDQHGKPFGRHQLKGRWSLLFTGFTHCPDICPQTLVVLDAVDERVRDLGLELQTVFLSVDPERDTPAQLDRYVGFFNEDFVALTGDTREIDRLCASLGFGYVKIPDTRDQYTVDHSTAVALIDPQGRLAGHFRQPLDVDIMAADLSALVGR